MEFDEFVRSRSGELVRFATALTADASLAEDLVQEVLINVHRRWDVVDALELPYGYVRRSVVNEYLSWRRKWARVLPWAVPPDRRTAPDHAERHATRSDLAQRLANLPAAQRAVLVLRYYAELTDSEIAEALGWRAGTVRVYASRALATLRVELTAPTPNESNHV